MIPPIPWISYEILLGQESDSTLEPDARKLLVFSLTENSKKKVKMSVKES